MNSQLEELYLEAEANIKDSNYTEAYKKYESILMDEPGNGPTLNSLGWLCKTQLEDYKKAEAYYKASISAAPSYPHSYINYATLLLDSERFEELETLLKNCFTIATIEKSLVYTKFGVMEELKLNYKEAISFFERAILVSLSDEKIKDNQQNIERCRQKIELSKNHSKWLSNAKG